MVQRTAKLRRSEIAERSLSGLPLPTRRSLLPVRKRVARLAGAAPAAAGGLDRIGVTAVEEIGATCIGLEILGFDALDEH
jgi:hypothetical protein